MSVLSGAVPGVGLQPSYRRSLSVPGSRSESLTFNFRAEGAGLAVRRGVQKLDFGPNEAVTRPSGTIPRRDPVPLLSALAPSPPPVPVERAHDG